MIKFVSEEEIKCETSLLSLNLRFPWPYKYTKAEALLILTYFVIKSFNKAWDLMNFCLESKEYFSLLGSIIFEEMSLFQVRELRFNEQDHFCESLKPRDFKPTCISSCHQAIFL